MKMNKKILGLTSVMILLPTLTGCFYGNSCLKSPPYRVKQVALAVDG